MSREQSDHPIRDSQHDPAGEMGVSSEREGATGPGQHATDGVRDVTPARKGRTDHAPPEKAPGAEEENPEGLEPKAAYPEKDPRSAD